MPEENYKEEEIKVRVPSVIKRAFTALKRQKFKSESELAREAFVEYLQRQGVDLTEKPAEPVYPAHERNKLSLNEVSSSQTKGRKRTVVDVLRRRKHKSGFADPQK